MKQTILYVGLDVDDRQPVGWGEFMNPNIFRFIARRTRLALFHNSSPNRA
ncbi:MAG: hypothetical protein NMNS02_12010 [Nitrosomonas sp.]|nr:MAG: hypothetical protein NMNS02_12010 [Nitrosomonas sp.]